MGYRITTAIISVKIPVVVPAYNLLCTAAETPDPSYLLHFEALIANWQQSLTNRPHFPNMMDGTTEGPPQDATRRLQPKKQTLDDAYAAPANFLEIDVLNPITHGVARKRYTDYEVRLRTNLPVFKLKDSSVRRRYSDFEWLRNELERDSKIVVPPLPGKAWKRQLPLRGDDGIYDEEFIEDRRKGLESFINKVAGHPLAQNERCLHMFLQDPTIDRNYVPGKIRNT
ncbi:sorting nexin-12 [Nephila pilipes]|uniref:Sorting nexin-3 n=1 Tax=Nephila pilipes TaxID=299642 RepID=A0A8X6MUL4_NEPPI|nr:sorting nexin-12 [Nephila pilipes]